MRRAVLAFILLLLLFPASQQIAIRPRARSNDPTHYAKGDLEGGIYYFYGQGCPQCAKVEPFIEETMEKHGIEVEKFEVYGDRDNMFLMREYFERFEVPLEGRGVPAIFGLDSYVVGAVNIFQNLETLIVDSSQEISQEDQAMREGVPGTYQSENGADSSRLSLLTLAVAALVDSVNPCSMAILFFLMAGLLMLRKNEKALKVGLAFTMSVFVANLLFGFGISTALSVTSFSGSFMVVAGLIAVLTGVLLIKDCLFYGGGGFLMEVPRFLRPYLKHKLSRAFFGRSSTLIGAFLAGFLVSLFEIPCTGGPYLYVLTNMADGTTRIQTVPTLLLYNLIFIMPLLVISMLLYFGSIKIRKAIEWRDMNIRALDFARGLPMIAVGLFTIPSELTRNAIATGLSIYSVMFIPLISIVAFYIAYQTLKSKNRAKTLRSAITFGLAAIILCAAIWNVQTTSTEVSLGFKTSQATCSGVDESEYGGDKLNVFASVASNGVDNDGDGYNSTVDCNDYDPLVHPGHAELCDRKDNDCDVHVDEPDVCLPGDADHKIENNHYKVDSADLALIGSGYGSVNGTERYEKCTNATNGSYCDLNEDGIINIFDLAKVGKNFGKTSLTCGVGEYLITVHVEDQYGEPLYAMVRIQFGASIIANEKTDPATGNAYFCLTSGQYIPLVWHPSEGQKDFNKFWVPETTYLPITYCISQPEVCDNGIDDDCDGLTDMDDPDCALALVTSNGVDNDGDGYNSTVDCNDYNPLVHPGHAELCDRKDNDCDDHVDEPDVCLPGDADHKIENNYYKVDSADLALIGSGYGSLNGTERYEKCTNATNGSYCDLNEDGIINVFDLAKVGKNFGNECLACIHVTLHVQDEVGQPLYEAYVKISTGAAIFVEEGLTDIYGNYETETCLEDGPYMYEMTTPVGCEKDWAFDVPDDTYVLVEPPWDHCW